MPADKNVLLRSLAAVILLLLSVVAGAQTAVVAGSVTTFNGAFVTPAGVAADGSGNSYVVTATGVVYKETLSSGVYSETQLFTVPGGLATAIAVDNTGANIYVSTGTGKSVLQFTGSGTTYSAGTSFTGFTNAADVAVDTKGNVYIVDSSTGNLIKESIATATTPPTFTQAIIGTTTTNPTFISVDTRGNVFTANATGNFRKFTGSGTAYTMTALTVSGATAITGMGVDANDNLFFAGTGTSIYEAALSKGAYATAVLYPYSATDLATDPSGNVYVVSSGTGTRLGYGGGYVNFGSVGPGAPATLTVAITLTSGGPVTLDKPTVVTQGLAGYDYQLASGGTCYSTQNVGATLSNGQVCTVTVQFNPQASGSRLGAINVLSGGKIIGSGYLGGVGFTPLAAYQAVTLLNTIACPTNSTATPPTACSATLPNGLNYGRGITVDPAGNVWVANSQSNPGQILAFVATSRNPNVNSQVPYYVNTTNGCNPVGTAIDGQGNVFYTCNGETNIYELPLADTLLPTAAPTRLTALNVNPVAIPISYVDVNGKTINSTTDDHLSADAAGNLYPTSYTPESNYFLQVAAGSHVVSVLGNAPTGARFVGATTDASGNTFAPDYNNGILYELAAGASTPTVLYNLGSTTAPHAIAEDAAGSLYVATTIPGTTGSGSFNLLRFPAGSYTSAPASLSVPGGDSLYITPDGDFYTVYSNSTLQVYSRSYFSLNFPNTAVGQTSASQTVTLENDGTAPLTISPPATNPGGTNPSTSINYTYDSSSTCPPLTPSSTSSFVLNAGASCTQVVEFTPTVASPNGTISGQVKTTDNSANVAGSFQFINLTGVGIAGAQTVTVASVSGTLGQNATLTATINGGGVIPTGAVSFVVGSNAAVAGKCTTSGSTETCTASYPTYPGLVAGANTITVSSAADTNYNAGTGTGTLTLAAGTTGSTVVSSSTNNTSTFGTSVTFTATVTSNPGTGAPTGTVTFYDNGSPIAQNVTLTPGNGNSSTASFTTTTLSVNTSGHPITVGYNGATSYAVSTSSAVSQIVNKAAGYTNNLTASTATPGYGDQVTFTDTLQVLGGVAPTGMVTFYVGSQPLGSGNIDGTGVATLKTNSLPVGSNDKITANYGGDSNYSPASAVLFENVSAAAVTTTDGATGSNTYGATNTPVTVTIPYAGVVAPVGDITLSDNASPKNTVTVHASTCTAAKQVLTCTITLATANEPTGNNTVNISEASEGSTGNYLGSNGTGTIVISAAPATTTDKATGTGSYGATTTSVTVTIPYGGVASPTGDITLSDTASPKNTIAVHASTCTAAAHILTCTIPLPTANEPVGSNAVNISQAADTNYLGSTGSGTVNIGLAAATTADKAAGSNTYGVATTPVTVTIPYDGVASPTGDITLADSVTPKNTITVHASTCTAANQVLTCTINLSTATEPVGNNAVTVNQAVDSNYSASSGGGTIVISAAPATTTDKANGTGGYGSATTPVTVTIPYAGSTAPTGDITLADSLSPKNTITVHAGTCSASNQTLTCTISLPTTNEPVGGNTLTVNQAADGNYSGSSGGGTLTINAAAVTTTDKATGSGTYGAATTAVTVTIPYAGAASPTGDITLSDGASPKNTITIHANAPGCSAASQVLTCIITLPTANEGGGANTVTVSQAVDTNYGGSSGSGTITIGPAAATTADKASGTGTYGAVNTSVTVSIPYAGVASPTGDITLSDSASPKNTITIHANATGCSAASQVLTCTVAFPTASEALGSNTVTVSQVADANYSTSTGGGTVTIGPAAVTTNDKASGNGTYGATTTTVAISIPYAGTAAPTGDITLSDSASPKNSITFHASSPTCGAANQMLTCSVAFPTASEALASNAVTVIQAGDSNYAGSTGGGSVVIGPAASTANDKASGTGTYGAATTAVTVTIPYAGTASPTGDITLSDNASPKNILTVHTTAAGCSAAGQVLTCTINLPTVNEALGSNAVTVSQAADSNYNTSTGTGTITIGPAAATTGDKASGANTYGASPTSVTVTIPYAGKTAPSGDITLTDTASPANTITFKASTCTAASQNLTCTVNFATANEPVGNNPVAVSEAGDTNYAGSTGAGTISITPAAGSASDKANGTGTYGAATTTVNVTIPYAGVTPPSGSITLSDNAGPRNTIMVAASSCTAASQTLSCAIVLSTANEVLGANTVTVTQAADSNYGVSNGGGTITIGPAAATSNDTASGSGTFGAASTPVTVTIPYAGKLAPTGSITLSDSASPKNTINVAANTCGTANQALTCVISLPTASEPVGSNAVTVSQVADNNYATSTGGGSITISPAAGSTNDKANGTASYGAATTAVAVSIPYTGTVSPSGQITLADKYGDAIGVAANTCTAAAGFLNCTINLPTINEPVGGNPVTVSQAADTNYGASSGGGTVTITAAAATNTDKASGTGSYGAATTSVTVTIPYAGKAAPTGDITLADNASPVNTLTVKAASCTAASQVLTCTINLPTANEPLGTNTLTVSQAADGNYGGSTGTGSIAMGPAATTTNDKANGTGTYGAATTAVTVTIPYAGTTAPTGDVTLADTHSNTLTVKESTCTAAAGTLTCTINLPTANEPLGANLALVSQATDNDYAGSSGSGTITIKQAPATAGDSVTGNGTYGAATTPVTITIPFVGQTAPAGAITVKDNNGNTTSNTTCTSTSTALTCTANLPTANDPVSTNIPLTVSQAADNNYGGSTGTGTLAIGKAAATTGDSANGTGTYGDATTQVIVTIPFIGQTAPSGAITVADSLGNTATIQASTCVTSGGALTCTVSLNTANEPTGKNAITVNQAGDGNYSGSSGSGYVTINPAGSRGDDTATGSGSYGAPSTPITVVIPFSGSTSPTGTVSVADTLGNTVDIPAANCKASATALVCSATLNTANEPVGSNILIIAQAADPNHASSTGSGTLNIAPAPATANDKATGAGQYGNATTSVTVTIPYTGVTAPGGAVSVTDSLGNTATVGASTCSSASQTLTCTVNLPTANEPLGSNTVTVAQAADTNYSGSSGSGTVTITTSPVSPVGNTSSGVQNVTITQGTASTLLTATLAYGGAIPPSGTVTFTVAGGSPVTATCSAGASPETCTAMYPTDSLAIGTYTITANEAADANYTAGTATGTLTVAAGSVSPILDSISYVGNVLITAGTQNATLTANITYTGPVPTGALTFNLPGGTPVTATCTSGPSPLACTASYPTASLAPATYVITALEAADSNYPQGEATALLTVAATASTPVSPILATGSYVNSVLVPYGTASASLYATIVFNGPPPTGAVTFTVIGGTGATVQGVCTSGSSPMTCTANYPTATLGIGGYKIQVNVAADSNYPAGSAIGTLTVSQVAASTTDVVTGSGNFGDPTSPVTVSIAYAGALAPTGAVTVTDSLNNTVTVQASACTAANGVLTCPANLPTANVPVGTDNATVAQGPDAVYAASTGKGSVTIGKATATTTDSASGAGTFGAATTPVTVTIPYAGITAPTGAITVSDSFNNTATIPATNCTAANGTLTCTTNFATANEPLGSNPLAVTQIGDSNYTGSTGNGTLTINQAGATTGDTATGTGTYGAANTAVTVTIPYVGSTAPTGAITVADTHNNTVSVPAAACTTASGTITCTVTLPTASEPTGANTVNVSQAADSNFLGSTGTGTVTINRAAATSGDTVNGSGYYGGASTPVTVTIPYVGQTPPSGPVTIKDNNGNTVTITSPATSCTAAAGVLTCQASLTTSNDPVGTNPITVTQAGDNNYSGSTGTSTSITIAKAPVTTGDTATGTGVYGSATTTVTVTIPYAGVDAPTGSITLTDTLGETVTVPASSCTAAAGALTCTVTFPSVSESVGNNPITVTQAGDSNYLGSNSSSTSSSSTITINKAAAVPDSATGTGNYGVATTPVTVTIPFTGAAPTGTITLADTHGNTVTVTSCTTGSATLTCTVNISSGTDPVGSNALTINQAADANHAASTGTGTLTINKALVTTTDSASGTGTYGAPNTQVSITIPFVGQAAPTGAITVTDTHTNTVTIAASTCTPTSTTLTCTATLPTANEPVGGNTVTVNQAGDGNYSGNSGTGTVTIGKAAATATDTASGIGTYGAATTAVTVNIPFAGVAAPTGAVTVTDSLNETVTVQGSTCTAAAGVLTCTVNLPTVNEQVGSSNVTVSQAGDDNYTGSTGTGTVTINKPGAATDTATGSGTYGAATTAVTISIPYTGAAPTGTITLADTHNNTVNVAATACTAANNTLTCPAVLPTLSEPAGGNTVTVSQLADPNHAASTGTGTITLAKAPATTTDTATGTGTYAAATTAITVTIPYVGQTAPTGAVTVADSFGGTATVAGTTCTAAAGTLTCTINLATVNEPVGSNPLTVTQIGDSNFLGSTGTGTATINKAAAGADSATGTGTYGVATTPVTITIPYTGAAPTGSILLADTHNNTVTVAATACTAANGTLTCNTNLSTANEPVGANAVTVSQAADANHAGSTGTGTVTINKAPATSTDTVTGTGTYAGDSTQVTVTIPYTGAAAPTGAITVSDSLGNTVTIQASSCTAAAGVLTCTAALPTANELLGSNQLTVAQAPDGNYSGSTGTGAVTINKPGASTGDTVTGSTTYGSASAAVTVSIPFIGNTAPTGAVTLTDSHGNTVTVPASACTAAKGVLSCNANLPMVNVPTGTDTITVAQAADAIFPGSTGTGAVTVAKAAATGGDTVTGSGNFGVATTAVTVTIPYAGATAPTGAITVADSNGNTVAVQASTCTAAKGVLTCTANLPTATAAIGTDNLTVSQAADANYSGSTGTGAVTIGKTKPTLTAPTVAPLNAAFGTSVTITQTVPAGETGTVTFYNGTTALGTATIANGVATFTTSALPVGTATITATANGDSNYAASTSPSVTDNVASTTTTVALTSSQAATTVGANVTFTATVTTPGTATIAGTVTFYDGATAIGSATVTNGVATASTATLAIGTHAITATFTPASGSTLTTATSAAVSQVVSAAVSSITLASSQNPAIVTQSITLSATVPTSIPGVAPSGKVTFYDGTTSIGTAQLNASGVASLPISTLTGGSHNITAVYAGDANYATSTSPIVAQKVADYTIGNTTPAMSADPGAAAAFNITVTPVGTIGFSAPVVLTVTGLPAKFSAAFGQGTVTPGSATASTTMTVQTFAQALTAMEHEQHIKTLETAAAWACLFPLLGLRRVRRRLPKALLMFALVLGSFGVIAPLTGCGGGYFGPQPASYTLTVTGTSGTLQRTTTVTLNVR